MEYVSITKLMHEATVKSATICGEPSYFETKLLWPVNQLKNWTIPDHGISAYQPDMQCVIK